MSKFFIWFLIVFAVIGSAVRVGINMQSPKPESSMVTYTDEELGFTLQYPAKAPILINEAVIIPDGVDPIELMASSTVLDGSGLNPEPSDFKKEITQYTTIHYIKSGQFEGTVSYEAYAVKDNFILPISYSWGNVDWTNPKYDSEQDPRFVEFMTILRSLRFINTEPGEYEGLHN